MENEPKPIGRPTVMSAETIAKLEEAFLNGASDTEAAFVAGIGRRTLYDYCAENPDFSHRKEDLKEMVKYQARMNIAKAINEGDKTLSQWYLERKAKDEFSAKTETENKHKIEEYVITYEDESDSLQAPQEPEADLTGQDQVQSNS